ncbi:MAG: hypothetical protein ACKOZW_13475, partial [Cyanobium sp.]
MFLLHFLSAPNPAIGYGVHALQLQRELSLLASGGAFWLQTTDLGRPGELEASAELLTTLPPDLPVVNVLLGDGRSSHELLDHLRG